MRHTWVIAVVATLLLPLTSPGADALASRELNLPVRISTDALVGNLKGPWGTPIAPSGAYSLNFHVLIGPDSSPIATEVQAREAASSLDLGFAKATRNRYRFPFGSFSVLRYPNLVGDCTSTAFMDALRNLTKPSLNSLAVVIVPTGKCLPYASQPGNLILLNDLYDLTSEEPVNNQLQYLVGRSLGLDPASIRLYAGVGWEPVRENPYQTWVPGAPTLEGQGDTTSIMGGYGPTGTDDDLVRLSAYESDLLGVYSESEIASVESSGTFVVENRRSGTGVKLLYLPVENKRQVAVEYFAWRMNGTLHGGVLVRGVFAFQDRGSFCEATVFSGNAVLQPRGAAGFSFFSVPGSRIDFADKTSIVVETMSDDAARIRIVRPLDVTPPQLALFADDPCSKSVSCSHTLEAGEQAFEGVFAPENVWDDRWVTRYAVKVDGKQVASFDSLRPATPQLRSITASAEHGVVKYLLVPGAHKVEILALDSSSNQASLVRTVNVIDPNKNIISNFRILNVGKKDVSLSWDAANGPVDLSTKVEFKTVGSSWRLMGTTKLGSNRFKVTGLISKTYYQFRLSVNGAVSKVISVRTR